MNFYEAKVKKVVKETSDSYSYIMEVPEGMSWKAGQHAMWKFKDYKVAEDENDGRIFTVASAPEDGFLMFTTRISEQHTDFKDILLNKVKEGDIILVADALGSYDMHMDKYDETLVIAGGIGITPIRSLIRHYMDNNNEGHKITILYSDDRKEFAYTDFWKEAESKMPNLDLRFISEREEFSGQASEYAKAKGNKAEYLIAGSPGLNKGFTETLKGLGVAEENIYVDNFMGYE